MICFSLRLVVPAAKRQEIITSITALLPPTRVQPDCISARLYLDAEIANVLTLIEQWSSRAALDRHLNSESSRVIVAAMDLSVELPEVRFDTIQHTGGMEVFMQARAAAHTAG